MGYIFTKILFLVLWNSNVSRHFVFLFAIFGSPKFNQRGCAQSMNLGFAVSHQFLSSQGKTQMKWIKEKSLGKLYLPLFALYN